MGRTDVSGDPRREFGGCRRESTPPLWDTAVASRLTPPTKRHALAAQVILRGYESCTIRRVWASSIYYGGFGRHTIRAAAWDRETTAARSTGRDFTISTKNRSNSSRQVRRSVVLRGEVSPAILGHTWGKTLLFRTAAGGEFTKLRGVVSFSGRVRTEGEISSHPSREFLGEERPTKGMQRGEFSK